MRAGKRIVPAFLVPLLVVTACKAGGAPITTVATKRPATKTGTIATKPETHVTRLVGGAPRTITQTGIPTQLIGKVKLISDKGGSLVTDNGVGVLGNNGAGIISNNTGNLVTDNGVGILGNNGAGLIGKVKYQVETGPIGEVAPYGFLQAASPSPTAAQGLPEFLLADADITVHDASGRVLVDADGKPLSTRSDGKGNYQLSAVLPKESLVLRIKLWNGGELSAMLGSDMATTREQPIDTAATLGAAYVLDRFVKGDQTVFNKLPASEAERLRQDLTKAQKLITSAPSFEPQAVVALAETLRNQDATVKSTLKDIEVLLLGGLGDGKQANTVAINRPGALAVAPDGTVYIGERDVGRVRRVAPDGTLTTWLDGAAGVAKANYTNMTGLALDSQGRLYVASHETRSVVRVAPDGTITPVLGNGQAGQNAALGGKATDLTFTPATIALGAGDALYIAEYKVPRILKLGADGVATAIPTPGDWRSDQYAEALCVAADGAIDAVVLSSGAADGFLAHRTPDGTWTRRLSGLKKGDASLVRASDGTLYVLLSDEQRVFTLAADGAQTAIAGLGAPADAPVLGGATSLQFGPDGTLYLADGGRGLVYARSPAGVWRVFAGVRGGTQTGNGQDLAINGPSGIAVDRQNNLYIAESTGNAILNWDGTTLKTVAGGVKGYAGDGGPALQARFDTPGSLVFRGDELIVFDARNGVLRSIGADLKVQTVVGNTALPDSTFLANATPVANDAYRIKNGMGLALGPDNQLYWSATGAHQIARQRADGKVELVAGHAVTASVKADDVGDGGDAAQAGLTSPLGLAFENGKGPALLVADTGNLRIRKVTGLDGGTPRIERFAGLDRAEVLTRLFALQPGADLAEEGVLASGTPLLGPSALCYDSAGNLYVAESGTATFSQFLSDGNSTLNEASLALGALEGLPPIPARVRKITPDGRIYTVIGPGGKLLTDPKAENALGLATGLAIDGTGRLIVVDGRFNTVRIFAAGTY